MNFLQSAADNILKKHGQNLSAVTVVLPTNRACYFFRKALADCRKTLWLPQITTLSEWVESTAGLKKISVLEEIMLLHKIYLHTGKEESLDEFIPLGRTLCSDFEEIDMHLVNQDWFFRELRNLASMKVYEPATELSSSQLDYLKFWERFEQLYKTLRSQMLQSNMSNTGMMFRKVAENIEHISNNISNFYFIGFDGLTKAEESIIKYLHINGKADVFWDTDEYYVNHNAREAGYFFIKYFETWKGEQHFVGNNILTQKKEIEIISVARSVGQAKVAVEIIANQLELTDATAVNTAVILPDEKLLQPLQYLLPAALGKYNLTMGLPVSRSLSGEFYMLLFKLHESAARISHRTKKTKLYYKDLIALIQHSFFSVWMPTALAQQIIRDVRSKNVVFVSQSFLNKSYPDIDTDVWNLLYAANDTSAYLLLLRTLTAQLIQSFYSRKVNEVELEFLLKISDSIDTITHSLSDSNIQPKTIRGLLTDEFKNHRVPFEGEPAEGLQIMGLMESRCLDFENVIILSTNEGVVPSGKSSKSYIPHPLRNDSMFSHIQKDAKAAYLFYRLFHKAKRIYLLYDTEGNNLGGGEKSRFILQLQYELAKANPLISIKELVYSVAPPEVLQTTPIVIEKSEVIYEKILSEAARGFSPSALGSFINCSLQYYFRYIAKLIEPDDVEEDMESNTMGTAIHEVLEKVYTEKVGQLISAEWVESVRANQPLIEKLLKEGFAKKFDEETLMQGKNHLQFRLSLKMIDMFLKNEIQRIKNGLEVKVEALETPLETTLLVNDVEVKIKGYADRIEWQNNLLTIVDFKSGKAKEAKLKNGEELLITENPELKVQFQLFTYAWSYLKQQPNISLPIQSGIFWLQKANNGFDNLSVDGNTLLQQHHFDLFEEQLKTLLEKMFDRTENFQQTEDESRCAYCAYKRICRRA